MKVAGTATAGADGQFAGDVRIGARGERRDFLVADVNPFDVFWRRISSIIPLSESPTIP